MKVLIVVDMVKDFVQEDGALYCGQQARQIIPFIQEKIAQARQKGDKIIYICDFHEKDDLEFRMFPAHCVKGSRGAEILDELKPIESDIIIRKSRYSGFYKTNLEEILAECKPEEVEVLGVCTSICVMDTVGGLRNRNYKVTVYKEGVADFDPKAHEFALERMRKIYGARVV